MMVFYSCVVDSGTVSACQLKIWVSSLRYLAGIPASRICVHVVGENLPVEEFLREHGVRFVRVERFGDGKFCNKLTQCTSPLFLDSDFVFLTDCDMAFLEPLDDCANYGAVVGKIVDMPNPPLPILQHLFKILNVKQPSILDTLNGKSFSNNFNGGLYGIPFGFMGQLGKFWQYYSLELLNSVRIKKLLGFYVKHIDQLAFSLAINYTQIPTINLPLEYNFPLHIFKKSLENNPTSHLKNRVFNIKAIHYHNCVNSNFLQITGNSSIDLAISTVNKMIYKYNL